MFLGRFCFIGNMGLSSNILWHQTDESGFFKILESRKLLYSYSQERIILSFKLRPVAFPMISVSDYPLSEIANNKWAYGNYCIGFKQEWGVKKGFSPVCYCSNGSRSLRQIDQLLQEAIRSDSQKLFGLAMYVFAHMKLVQAPLVTKSRTFRNYRFYDEREWRVVPYITETDNVAEMPFLTEDGYKEYKDAHNGSSLLTMGVDFNYDDISYIIVEKREDVQKVKDLLGDSCHIFMKEEVETDVVGVGHHVEILPSPEQQDYEAALRHVERTSKRLQEALERRKKNKDTR